MIDEEPDSKHTLVKEDANGDTYELMEALLGSEHLLYTFYIYGEYDDEQLIEYGIDIHIIGFLSWKIEKEMRQAIQEDTIKTMIKQFGV